MSRKKITLSSFLDSPILSRIVVGIGEVSEITGVSARQLRYWESKGIISSIGDNSGSNRKYDYSNIEKVVLIKDFLDQGYTLEAAAKRMESRIQQLNAAIIKLSAKISPREDGGEKIDHPVKINGLDYVFIGHARNSQSDQRLKIYAPLDEKLELLAIPED